MSNRSILKGIPSAAGDLVWRIGEAELGFRPAGIWNSSPSIRNFTGFYELPHTVTLGTTFEMQESASRFSPPPFAVAVRDEAAKRRTLLNIAAERGHHLFATATFAADAEGVTVTVELEGHSDPETERDFIRLELTEAVESESNLELLKRGLALAYPEASAPKKKYDWWRLPIFCAGGAGGAFAFHLFGPGGEARCMPFATEWMVQRNLDILKSVDMPIGSVIIDCGWSPGGLWKPHHGYWPDLKGWIAKKHQEGIKVILWLGLWFTEGLPDKWCLMANPNGKLQYWDPLLNKDTFIDTDKPERFWADAGNPEYLEFVAQQIRELVSPDGYDADGFKIDMLQMTPCERFAQGREHWDKPLKVLPKTHPKTVSGAKWGVELLYDLQKTIHDAAKSVKPDVLVNSSTGHPYFHDTFDMLRLHDTCHIDAETNVYETMAERARLSRAALPAHEIDTDNWIHSYYDKWMDYTLNSYKLGTPCLFFTDYFVTSFTENPAACPIPREDLRKLADNWRKVLNLK